MTPASSQPDDDYLVPRRRAHFVLFVLFMLMAFDFIDRQVLAALLPSIKSEWALTDAQLGALVSAVNVAIAILAIPTGLVVDRWSRTRSIGLMAVVWSLATAACSLAGNYMQLLVARFFIGAGEAGYSSGGNTLLAGLYPRRLRATVIGIFQSASMFGSVIGVVLGGVIAAHWGWRAAFGLVALPGLVFAVMVFFVSDYRTVQMAVRETATGGSRSIRWHEILATIFRSPTMMVLFVGEAALLFFVSTLGNWIPSFFHRVHGLSISESGIRTGMLILMSAAGVALGGWVVDKVGQGKTHRRLYGAAVFAALTALLNLLAFQMPAGALQMALLFAGALFMVGVLGPVMSAVQDLVHPGMRSAALGSLITFSNLFGMALGPTVAGQLSDWYDLQTALWLMSFMPLLAAALYVVAARRYRSEPGLGNEATPAPTP